MRVHLMRWIVAAVLLAAGPTAARSDPASQNSTPVPGSATGPAASTGPAAVSAAGPVQTDVPSAMPVPTSGPPAPATNVPAGLGVPAGLLPKDLSVGAMFHNADIVVQAVLVGLIAASIVTWTFLFGKGFSVLVSQRSILRALKEAETERSLASLRLRMRNVRTVQVQHAMTEATAAEMMLSAGQDAAGIKERIASRLHRLEAAAGRRMARGTGVLATIGSTAPFVGLFGTVWGIMNSFIGISQSQTTNLAVVAPGIAEALLATATGLVAAIPAVVIYNVFARAIAGYRASLADLSAAILRLVSRELDGRGGIRTSAAAE